MPIQKLDVTFRIQLNETEYEGKQALVLLHILLFPECAMPTIASQLDLPVYKIQQYLEKIAYGESRLSQSTGIRKQFAKEEQKGCVIYYGDGRDAISLQQASEIMAPYIQRNKTHIKNQNEFFTTLELVFYYQTYTTVEKHVQLNAVLMLCDALFPDLGEEALTDALNVSRHSVSSFFKKIRHRREKFILKDYVQNDDYRAETTETVEIYYDGQLHNIADIRSKLCEQFPALDSMTDIEADENSNAQESNNGNEIGMCDAPLLVVESDDADASSSRTLGQLNDTEFLSFFSPLPSTGSQISVFSQDHSDPVLMAFNPTDAGNQQSIVGEVCWPSAEDYSFEDGQYRNVNGYEGGSSEQRQNSNPWGFFSRSSSIINDVSSFSQIESEQSNVTSQSTGSDSQGMEVDTFSWVEHSQQDYSHLTLEALENLDWANPEFRFSSTP